MASPWCMIVIGIHLLTQLTYTKLRLNKTLGNGWTVDVIAHIFRELYFKKENTVNCQEFHQESLF